MQYVHPLFIILIFFSSIVAQNKPKKLPKLSFSEIDSLMHLEYNNHSYDKAIAYLEIGRIKAKKQFGELDSIFASYTANLGLLNSIIGKQKEAEKLLIQAKNIQKEILGSQHLSFATSLNSLAILYKEMGEYEKAENLFIKTKNIIQKSLGDKDLKFAITLSNLADLYLNMGKYEEAEELLLHAKHITSEAFGEKNINSITTLNNLAALYRFMEEYEKAEVLFMQIGSIIRASYGEEHIALATNLNNLAALYQSMGKSSKVEKLLIQTKEIIAKTLGEKHPKFAITVNNLADLYFKLGKYKKAEALFLQAGKIIEKNLGREHPSLASTLCNLAALYERIGAYNKSEKLLFEAKDIRLKTLGTEHPDYAIVLNNIGRLYEKMNRLEEAFLFCKRSIAANSIQVDTHFIDWSNLDSFIYYSNEYINTSINTTLSVLEKQYRQTGDKSKIELYYEITRTALRFNDKIRNNFSGNGTKLRTLSKNTELIKDGLRIGSLLNRPIQDLFQFAEYNKSVFLLDAIKSTHLYQLGNLPDSLFYKEKNIRKKQATLEANLLENQSKNEKDSLLGLLILANEEIDLFNKKLRKEYPKYTTMKYEQKRISIAEIQSELDERSALIEYVIGDSIVYVFYIDKYKVRLKLLSIDINELNMKIKNLRGILNDYNFIVNVRDISYERYVRNAHWFYKELLAPVLTSTTTIENLVIITDGELGHIPFETFLVEAAPQFQANYKVLHYLLNDYNISYSYSASLWRDNNRVNSQKNNGKLLAMAASYNPEEDSIKMNWRLPAHKRLRSRLTELPAARAEVKILTDKFDGFFGLDSLASEKVFKNKASEYAILHLSMHGLLDHKNQMLSSLAFSEDGDSLENNFLHAYEISKMDLNADLVVLSACETGFGKFEQGNGITSLAQNFAYAGVPSLVASLWQVNDYATSVIMEYLYQNLANGMEKSQALREAKLKYIREAEGELAHPAFWSPFIQIGNTLPIHLALKKSFSSTFWGITGVILILLMGILMKYKKSFS